MNENEIDRIFLNEPHLVTDPAEIDLSRHALIEASAGTGKTYTIENLVVRLILEQEEIGIENILLVTFTEKAAGELKARIRAKFSQQYRLYRKVQDPKAQKLKGALDNFDQASVFTIHGFCQNLLSELAFENNTLFENELKEDHALYDSLLKDQIRRVWPARYGDHLSELLQLCRFCDDKDRLLTKIIYIARNLSLAAGDRLWPSPDQASYHQFRRDLVLKANYFAELLTGPPLFSDGYAKLNINARTRKSLIEKIIGPLELFFSQQTDNTLDLGALSFLFAEFGQVRSGQKKGLSALIPVKWLKAGPNPEVCPQLEKVLQTALEIENLILVGVHWIVRETIFDLKTAVRKTKRQHGWIGFDDMLFRVYRALNLKTAPLLLERIRAKYKIAFVDEFQDTDPVQWRIFRRIFIDDSNQSRSHPLIIIGDPKQAIYSFRGADVYAYLEARAAMADLSQRKKANLYSLCYNWRSLPSLVDGFNHLFSVAAWFPPQTNADDFEIGYDAAISPGIEKLPFQIAADDSSRGALNLIDLRSLSSPRQARKALGEFIAAEIKRLLCAKTIWFQSKANGKRALDYGDICILIRSKSEAKSLENCLRSAGIPYGFYKKPGLFQSDQAQELSLMLHAVLDPGNGDKIKKALLTPFFDADPSFLFSYGDVPLTHPVRQLLLKWNDLALRRQWRPLFQSLMAESGLTFRLSPRPEWDRVHTNFSQLFEHLECEAYRRNLDLRALLALLDGYQSKMILAEEGADIHQIDTDARKVQIMTMHVSKGLQFPIVFIGGGFTRPNSNDYHLFHQPKADNFDHRIERIFDLSKQNQAAHQREEEDEDRRLFYVALTRAQMKLYLPYYPNSKAYLWVGPLSKFVADAILAVIEAKDPIAGMIRIKMNSPDSSIKHAQFEKQKDHTQPDPHRYERLSLPIIDDFRPRKIHLNSFSSLNALLTYHPQPALEQDFQPYLLADKDADDDMGELAVNRGDLYSAPRSPSELPSGPKVGSMLHDILEQIDYGLVDHQPQEILSLSRTATVIARNMSLYQIPTKWRESVAALIIAALTTPINLNGDKLVLAKLTHDQRQHEVEFYFPYIWGKAPLISDQNHRYYLDNNGYIRGFIDLIFQFESRYYIVDWKSNFLVNGYGPEALKESMEHSGYHLQYRIYSLALLRWLEQTFGGVSKALDLFGGVFYLYLRGMGTGEQNGIFHVSPADLGTRQTLEQELEGILLKANGKRGQKGVIKSLFDFYC
jgi:exodeoxyribonuclease V beta subunit